MILLDLFSNIGGFAYAAEQIGYHVIGMHEGNDYCNKVLAKNFPAIDRYEKLKDIKITEHIDIITSTLKVYSDDENKKEKNNWKEIKRTVRRLKPTWFITTGNTRDFSMALDDMFNDLDAAKYQTISTVLPACATGAPYRQDRIWIIAFNAQGGYQPKSNWICEDKNFSIKERDFASIFRKWEQSKPDTWTSYKVQDWLEFNSRAVGDNARIPNRLDRFESIRNTVIPQMAYAILHLILDINSMMLQDDLQMSGDKYEKKLRGYDCL